MIANIIVLIINIFGAIVLRKKSPTWSGAFWFAAGMTFMRILHLLQ